MALHAGVALTDEEVEIRVVRLLDGAMSANAGDREPGRR